MNKGKERFYKDLCMSESGIISRVRVDIALSQIVGARREAQDPMRRVGEVVAGREPTLNSIISCYGEIMGTAMAMEVRETFEVLKKILRQRPDDMDPGIFSSDEERENREVLDQLNRVYSEEESLEERRFTEHVLEYYRRKITEEF